MTNVTEIKQGDDYAEDFVNTEQDAANSDWTGKWSINKADGIVLASGVLSRDTGDTTCIRMQLRIKPSDTANIPLGRYKLIVEVSNAGMDVNREIIRRQCNILAQGIS